MLPAEEVSYWSWPLSVLNLVEKERLGFQTQSWLVFFFAYELKRGADNTPEGDISNS